MEDQEIEEKNDDDEEEADVGYDDTPLIQSVEDGKRYYTNPTIWIGVLPDTLTGGVAHESSKDIRTFLEVVALLTSGTKRGRMALTSPSPLSPSGSGTPSRRRFLVLICILPTLADVA